MLSTPSTSSHNLPYTPQPTSAEALKQATLAYHQKITTSVQQKDHFTTTKKEPSGKNNISKKVATSTPKKPHATKERKTLPEAIANPTSNSGFPLWGSITLSLIGVASLGALLYHFSGGKFFRELGEQWTGNAEKKHPNATTKPSPSSGGGNKGKTPPIPPHTPEPPAQTPLPPSNLNPLSTGVDPQSLPNTPVPVPHAGGYNATLLSKPKTLEELTVIIKPMQGLINEVVALETTKEPGTTVDETKLATLKTALEQLSNELAEEHLAIVLQAKMNLAVFIDDDWHSNHAVLHESNIVF
jgi:hypothetical protein